MKALKNIGGFTGNKNYSKPTTKKVTGIKAKPSIEMRAFKMPTKKAGGLSGISNKIKKFKKRTEK